MPDRSLALLCGGRSTRLGTDKGLFAYLGDEPLFLRGLRLLGGAYDELLLVVRDAEQEAKYRAALDKVDDDTITGKTRIVRDDAEAPSAAMSGIRTALASARHDAVMVLPVDQVGVRALHLKALAPEGARVTAFSLREFGADVPLPFPSLWHRSAKPALDDLIAQGNLSVRGALAFLDATLVDAADFTGELSVNANTAADFRAYFGEPLHDPFKRRLHYLRFSLTEACNMSCTYCLPDGFPEWYRHKARLSTPDIQTLLGGFRRLGFRKVRLTGGEPTVHPGCAEAVRTARKLGYEQIAMTTNGLLVGDPVAWMDAGLTQLNVSLDSLDAATFKAMTKSDGLAKVVGLIESAAARGLEVKINTVLLRSQNGSPEQIARLVDWALERPVTLRFIELMETKLNGTFSNRERVLGTEIEPVLRARGLVPARELMAIPNVLGPATDFAHPTRPGRIGMINPMSCNFCSKCNRLRVTARGELKLCLFGDANHALDLTSAEAVALNVRHLIDRKPERHHLEDGAVGNVATFRTIGG